MSNDTQKISELGSAASVPENSMVPIVTVPTETNQITLSSLRSVLNFESAFDTIELGLAGTEKNEPFFVYTDDTRSFVNGYLNQGGGTYTSLLDKDGKQINNVVYSKIIGSVYRGFVSGLCQNAGFGSDNIVVLKKGLVLSGIMVVIDTTSLRFYFSNNSALTVDHWAQSGDNLVVTDSSGNNVTLADGWSQLLTGGTLPVDVRSETIDFWERIKTNGQFDLTARPNDPKGIAGIVFGGKNNKGALVIDQRGRLQTYAIKNGVMTAARMAIPVTEPYGYGAGSRLGSITRFPVSGAEDDTLSSSIIFLPQADGSVKAYLAGPGLYTNFAAPFPDAVKRVAKEIVTADLLPSALLNSSTNPTDWLSTESWVKLVTVNDNIQGSTFTGIYSGGAGLSEAVCAYLIEFQSKPSNVTTVNANTLRYYLRITSLRSRGDLRYSSGTVRFGVVRDATANTSTLYARLAVRSENSSLIPLRADPPGSDGVAKVTINTVLNSYVTTEPAGIVYLPVTESLTTNVAVQLNNGTYAQTRGAVIRLTNNLSANTRGSFVTSGEFAANDTLSAINRGYAGLGTVTAARVSTGKYTITGASTGTSSVSWKITPPFGSFGSGIQNLVAVIESDVSNVITIGVRKVLYTADTTTGAVTTALGDYVDIPNDTWIDIHTTLN